MKPRIISSIIRRELMSYFASPTGYVFITIFIFLSAFAAFWLPGFFARNLANLDQLNAWFPALLLLIVPAITMGAWSDERKQGTEELLLTLPARDWQLVLGKYLACLLIYTAALGFSLSHVLVLTILGNPDLGLMLSTYLGYWLSGAGLLAVGLVASSLTANLTISFIVAAVLCAAIVMVGQLRSVFPGTLIADAATALSLPARFDEFGKGVITVQNLAYFGFLTGLGLWLNTMLISRRHWSGSTGAGTRLVLALVRGAALVVIAGAMVALLARTPLRADATAEGLWSISDETHRLIDEIGTEHPVFITAYVSRDVPSQYVETRETLLGLLRELDAAGGGGRIEVEVIEPELFSREAQDAKQNFNIDPVAVATGPDDPQRGARNIFMGLAFTRGPEQFVLPFLSAGLPVEYELVRSIRSVSQESRKRIGVLDTPLAITGGFDYQTYNSQPAWPIVDELRKQYDVVIVNRGAEVRDDLDVLIVPQPSLLTDSELAPVVDYVADGHATLIIEDPLPIVNPSLGTSFERGAGSNPFQRQQQPLPEPKADLAPLWTILGARVEPNVVLWDSHNPHPQFDIPREFIFVTNQSGAAEPFNPREPATSGLQEVVFLAPGEITLTGTGERATGLLYTSRASGRVQAGSVLQRSFFGFGNFNPGRQQTPTLDSHLLAMRVSGINEDDPINAIVVSDVDFMNPSFFALREQGAADLNFDNVTLILNLVDTLAGDESLVELRKRRPVYRTLDRIDARRAQLAESKDSEVQAANTKAENEIAKAQATFDRKVDEIQQRQELDETTRNIMIQSVQKTEQRRLEVRRARIEKIKQDEIKAAETDTQQQIAQVQTTIRLLAVAIPPIPALALAGMVFIRRRAQELEGVARERLR